MPSKQVELILFDLGNVLVELDGFPWFKETSPELKLDEIHRRWIKLECIKLFETGQIDENSFFRAAIKELGLLQYQGNEAGFSEQYRNWVINFYPDSRQLLQELKSNFRVACLSNTNAFHINHLRSISSELELFEQCFFSHEIGVIKPDPKAFVHVIEQLELPPEKILFLDDSLDNINAAKTCGMQVKQVVGINEVLTYLKPYRDKSNPASKP